MTKIHRENLKRKQAEEKRRLKAFEKAYPESTLAIGNEAVKASAEKWNREHPDAPVTLPELPATN
jgi:hypothetical protein